MGVFLFHRRRLVRLEDSLRVAKAQVAVQELGRDGQGATKSYPV